ncbi:MAG TPA: leucyl/phenylalanyl-tRNA--protein transferase [Pseudolabrys sp.]|nr:leucyl/phenylalanyl-tRNA--protein transferase [Pseudolabrys sp.]
MAFETERLSLPAAASGRAARRAALFRESPLAAAERVAVALAWGLLPKRIGGVPNLLKLCFHQLLTPDRALPDPERAYDNPPGLAGIGHELSVPTLLAGYRRGLYPLALAAPMKWWSPPMRSLLFFEETHIAKRLRRQMRQGRYTVSFDRDFEAVIAGCAHRQTRWNLTWITPRVMRAYAELFDAGHVHSFEVWNEKGELVGGGYGVAIGGAFATESQFSREPNTSKIGFTALNWHLARWGFAFNDGKVMTPTCRDMGFREIARGEFLARLADAAQKPGHPGRWQAEADVAAVAEWQTGPRL